MHVMIHSFLALRYLYLDYLIAVIIQQIKSARVQLNTFKHLIKNREWVIRTTDRVDPMLVFKASDTLVVVLIVRILLKYKYRRMTEKIWVKI